MGERAAERSAAVEGVEMGGQLSLHGGRGGEGRGE